MTLILGKLKEWALLALAILLAVGAAFRIGKSSGRSEERLFSESKEAKITSEVAQSVVASTAEAKQVEDEVRSKKDEEIRRELARDWASD